MCGKKEARAKRKGKERKTEGSKNNLFEGNSLGVSFELSRPMAKKPKKREGQRKGIEQTAAPNLESL